MALTLLKIYLLITLLLPFLVIFAGAIYGWSFNKWASPFCLTLIFMLVPAAMLVGQVMSMKYYLPGKKRRRTELAKELVEIYVQIPIASARSITGQSKTWDADEVKQKNLHEALGEDLMINSKKYWLILTAALVALFFWPILGLAGLIIGISSLFCGDAVE